MMDSKYRPDGWLGFIVGSKFWIDFSEKHRLDSNADKLVKELGSRGKTAVHETTVNGLQNFSCEKNLELHLHLNANKTFLHEIFVQNLRPPWKINQNLN